MFKCSSVLFRFHCVVVVCWVWSQCAVTCSFHLPSIHFSLGRIKHSILSSSFSPLHTLQPVSDTLLWHQSTSLLWHCGTLLHCDWMTPLLGYSVTHCSGDLKHSCIVLILHTVSGRVLHWVQCYIPDWSQVYIAVSVWPHIVPWEPAQVPCHTHPWGLYMCTRWLSCTELGMEIMEMLHDTVPQYTHFWGFFYNVIILLGNFHSKFYNIVSMIRYCMGYSYNL